MDKNEKITNCLVSVLKAAAYFGVYFGVQVVIGIFIGLIFSIGSVASGTMPDVTTLLYKYSMEITLFANVFSILGCIGLSFLFKRGERRVDALLDINIDFGRRWKIIVSCLLLGVVGQFSILLILSIIPFPAEWLTLLEDNSQLILESPMLIRVLSVAIVAPLAEEIIFRACIQGSLQRGMPKWAAIVIASLVFGVMHGTPIGIIYASVLGVLMGWLYAEFDSIVPSMLFHFTYNLTSLLINEQIFENPVAYFIYLIVSTVLFALCIGYIICQSRAARKEKISNIQGDNDNEAL